MRRILALFALLLPLLTLLAGCGDKEAEITCTETAECGFGETCLDGVCQGRSCSSSAGCPVGSHCSGGSCVSGCEGDQDCYPDSICTEGACVARGCRNTTLDCAFGEFCDVNTGECYAASSYYCKPCVYGSSDEDQCGAEGNLCYPWGQYGDFCGVECEETTDCPAGYDCLVVSNETGPFTKQCLSYCWLYITDDSRATARPLPPSALPPLGSPSLSTSATDLTCGETP